MKASRFCARHADGAESPSFYTAYARGRVDLHSLSCSSLHRLFQRNRIIKLPENEEKKPKKFKKYPICYFYIDITEVRIEGGKLYLFVAIDCLSKFVYVELSEKQGKIQVAEFLKNLIDKVPYKIHSILRNNGVQFTNKDRNYRALLHIFDRICEENGIGHRPTLPAHPWKNDQVERMNKTIKEATVHRYYYESQTCSVRASSGFYQCVQFRKTIKIFKRSDPLGIYH